MSSSYSRVKKWRTLHKVKKNLPDNEMLNVTEPSVSDVTISTHTSENHNATEKFRLQVNNDFNSVTYRGSDYSSSDNSICTLQ